MRRACGADIDEIRHGSFITNAGGIRYLAGTQVLLLRLVSVKAQEPRQLTVLYPTGRGSPQLAGRSLFFVLFALSMILRVLFVV